jgi:hypothetical protein
MEIAGEIFGSIIAGELVPNGLSSTKFESGTNCGLFVSVETTFSPGADTQPPRIRSSAAKENTERLLFFIATGYYGLVNVESICSGR